MDDALFLPGIDDGESDEDSPTDGRGLEELHWDSVGSSSTGISDPGGGFAPFDFDDLASSSDSVGFELTDFGSFDLSVPAPPVQPVAAAAAAALPTGPVPAASNAPPANPGSDGPAELQSRRAKKRRQADREQAAFDTAALPTVPPQEQLVLQGSIVHDNLDNRLIYKLLSDRTQVAHGPRPAVWSPSDTGAVYIERQRGPPGKLKPKRRELDSPDLWKQSSVIYIQQVEGISFGADGKGEVWVKKTYGKVRRPKAKAGKAADPPYHAYYLCYYARGRDPAHTRDEQGKSADHVVGCVFHLHGSAAAAQPAARRAVTRPTDIQLSDAADPNWLRFKDATGEVRGSVSLNQEGTTLFSTNGDFAEYHKRDPREPAFEEGDLVGFGERGLTRQTKGVLQLGVITRRAIVTGTCPATDEAEGYDTVAYVGMVPVKLRGRGSKGQFVAPSGRADGTAVATSWRPEMSVGRIYNAGEKSKSSCCACTVKRQAVWFATIAVFNPADTVRPELKSTARRLAERAACVAAVAIVVALVWLGLLYPCGSSDTVCAAVSLPHGQLSGVCDGTCGSSCTYQGCDAGYVLVAAEDKTNLAHWGKRPDVPAHTRMCVPRVTGAALGLSFGQRPYGGFEMSCVRTGCPAETVGAACSNCRDETVSIRFPAMRWSPEQVNISCPAGFSGSAHRTCDPTGWSTVRGGCRRLQCPRTELALSGGPATMTQEQKELCYRSRARKPSGTVIVDREVELLCEKLFRHTVTLNASLADSDRLTVNCPSPQYTGSISATCEPNSSRWKFSGVCAPQYCPAQWRELALSSKTDQARSFVHTHTVSMHLPRQEAAEVPGNFRERTLSVEEMNAIAHASTSDVWSVVPCCSHLSHTGSCLDRNVSYGYVTSRCTKNKDGELHHQVWSNLSGWVPLDDSTGLQSGCVPSDQAIRGVKMDQSSTDAAVLFRELAHTLRMQLFQRVTNNWNIPLNGSLSSISVSMDVGNGSFHWRPVMSLPRRGSSAAIDANPPAGNVPDDLAHSHRVAEFGRSAAAFADVSCRQLGWKRAVVVTNCQALFNLRRRMKATRDEVNADWWARRQALDADTDIFMELCPEFRGGGPKARNSLSQTMCPRFLEVGEQPLWQNSTWEAWLRVNALNILNPENFSLAYDSFFRGMPYQMDNVSGNWTLSPDGFNPLPATSSCSGAEKDIRQCFWSQVQKRLQGGSVVSEQPEPRPCAWKIVVGCTDEHSNAALAAADAAGDTNAPPASPHEGIWLIGDQPDDIAIGSIGVDSNFFNPKIFSRYGGPYNCSTGQPVPDVQIAQRKWGVGGKNINVGADWCWGRLLNVSGTAFGPETDYCLECQKPHSCLGHTTCDVGCEHCSSTEIVPGDHGDHPPPL